MKIKIITDVSSDLSEEVKQKYDITVIPMEVRFGDEIYPEGLTNEEFYKKIRTFDGLPKTSQITEIAFEEILTPYTNKEDVFVIMLLISSELSGTYNQARIAVDSLKANNVYLIDSQQVTFALGALITEVAKFAETHNDPEEIKKEIKRLREKVKLIAIIGDLKYLKLGGRLSSASAFLGSMLNIKPLIHLQDGKVLPCYKALGNLKAQLFMLSKVENRDKSYPMYFGHSDCEKDLKAFMEKYKDRLELKGTETITYIGSLVGTHAGPGAYGIVYFEK